MQIDWSRLEVRQYDHIVEAYLTRLLGTSGKVVVHNGRGGDGGKDVEHILADESVHIYQLKFFPGGLGVGGRRQQVKRSFKAAMQHAPARWVLVVPDTLTPPEQTFLQALPKGVKDCPPVVIDYLDRPQLESGISRFPDLVEYFQRDAAVAMAKLWQQEQAALTAGVKDLHERVMGLGRLTSGLDPYWDVDFARQGNLSIQTIRAKSPESATRSPISIRFDAEFSDGDSTLEKSFKRAIAYGVADAITLPQSVVKNFKVDGPDWLAGEREGVEVQWWPVPSAAEGRELELRVAGEDGTPRMSCTAPIRHFSAGVEGHNVRADLFGGAMTVSFFLPDEASESGTVDFRLPDVPVLPADLLKALRLRGELFREPTLELFLDGQRAGLLQFQQPPALSSEEVDAFADLEALARDFDTLQRHSGQEFPLPKELTGLQRVQLRATRLLLEGNVVVYPDAQRLTITLSGADSVELRQVLGDDPSVIRCDQPNFTISLLGRQFSLGAVCVVGIGVTALDGAKLISALDDGRAEGQPAVLQVAKGRHFLFYRPDLLSVDEHTPLRPVPWGLRGIDEPVDVLAATDPEDASAS